MGFDLSAIRCIADLSGLIESTYSQLIAQGCGGDVLPVDSFLSQEGPRAVSSDEDGPATKRSRSGTKWHGKHRAMFASARRHPSSTGTFATELPY